MTCKLQSTSLDDAALTSLALHATEATVATLRDQVEIAPERVHAWASLGIACARTGLYDPAVQALQRALEVAPGHVQSTAYLGSCLHMSGREDAARELLDYEEMVDVCELQPDASPEEVSTFNASLVEHVLANPSLTWQLEEKATRGGFQTEELLDAAAPEPIRRFQSLLGTQLDRLLSDGASGTSWTLTAWGVSLRNGGYQLPHVHPRGLLSGVYYAQVPAMGDRPDAGALRFRHHLPWLPSTAATPSTKHRVVRPRPGMLVMFPSYFWHDTVPFESESSRVSLAFDVLASHPTE